MKNIETFPLLLLLISIFTTGKAQINGNFTADNNNYLAQWSADPANNLINFTVTANTQGWVAIGFSNSGRGHTNTDSVVGWVLANGDAVVIDSNSNSQTQPLRDQSQNITVLGGSQDATSTTISFSRPIMSADPNNEDVSLNVGVMTLAWAYGTNDGNADANNPTYTIHATRGADANVNFLAGAPGAGVPTTTPPTSTPTPPMSSPTPPMTSPTPPMSSTTPPTATMTGSFMTNDGNYRATWLTDVPNNLITFTISANTQGWISIGFGNNGLGHSTTDSVVGWVLDNNLTPVVIDSNSNARSQPLRDQSQDITVISSSQNATSTTITFSRPITSADPNNEDNSLNNGPMTLAWAYGANDGNADVNNPTYAIHDERGVLNVDFLQAQTANSASHSKSNTCVSVFFVLASMLLAYSF